MKSLAKKLSRFSKQKVFVVGDIMLDHYIYGAVERISPEAPVPVVRATQDKFFLGGAANVAANVRSFGAATDIMGRIGHDDEAGKTVLRLLEDAKINKGMVCANMGIQTIEKIRVASSTGHQLVRIDREGVEPYVLPLAREKEVATIRLGMRAVDWCDALIISDYQKGFVTKRLAFALTQYAEEQGKIIVVDTKPAHFGFFKCVTAIKPNKKEAEVLLGQPITDDSSAEKAAWCVRQHTKSAVVLTRGADGMTILDGSKVTHLPGITKEVFDVTGAGDTVTAVLALGLASGLPLKDAATVANHAAAIAVGKSGTATVTLRELRRSMA